MLLQNFDQEDVWTTEDTEKRQILFRQPVMSLFLSVCSVCSVVEISF